jgi:3-methylfumaryl-CoA hydratase
MGLAATLEVAEPADGVLPPLWYVVIFPQWVRPSEARPDGGIRGEGFLPPFDDYPRRLAAGTRTWFHAPLRLLDEVTRSSRIGRIQEKQGRSGPFLVVTVERTYSTSRGVAVTEEHDYIYRKDEPKPRAASGVRPLPPTALIRARSADTVTVFQYSALVGVSHRIHFDLDYARDVEGFPGLLIQGPLRAIWLTSLLTELCPGAAVSAVDFRHLGPAYHTDRFLAAAWEDGELIRLELRNQADAVCTEGTATLKRCERD